MPTATLTMYPIPACKKTTCRTTCFLRPHHTSRWPAKFQQSDRARGRAEPLVRSRVCPWRCECGGPLSACRRMLGQSLCVFRMDAALGQAADERGSHTVKVSDAVGVVAICQEVECWRSSLACSVSASAIRNPHAPAKSPLTIFGVFSGRKNTDSPSSRSARKAPRD